MNAQSVGAPDLVGIVTVSLYQTDETTVAKGLINRLECDHSINRIRLHTCTSRQHVY
jgi:hypothetical protein